MTKLIPCPFCGSEAEIDTICAAHWNNWKEHYRPDCTNKLDCVLSKYRACNAYESIEEAIKAWSRRS